MNESVAALIGHNVSFFFLTFLPPIVWLLFYLREDEHPEPKRLIMATFIGGVIIAIPAALIQFLAMKATGVSSIPSGEYALGFLFFIALTEEYAKYFVVRYLIEIRPEFDEPIDAMIYMMSAAMGFAAIENALFAFPTFNIEFFKGLELVAGRFLGANLLHVLSSGVLGFFLAKGLLAPRFKKLIIISGLLTATVLHTAFNYLIIVKEGVGEGLVYVVLFLFIIALMVFREFSRLKKRNVNFTNVTS